MHLVMHKNRIVTNGLQTTQTNFTNVPCIVHKWQCGVQFLLMALFVTISLRMQSATNSCWKHICMKSYILFTKICCGSNKMEQLLTQHKLPCKSSGQCFQADSFLISGTSPSSPTHSPDLVVPDYFLWGYIKSTVYETWPANIDDLKQHFWSVFKGSPRQCYNMLWQPFHCNYRSVLMTWWSIFKQ